MPSSCEGRSVKNTQLTDGAGEKSPEKNRSESGVEDFACWERKTSTLQNWLQIKKENLLQFSVMTSPALYERNMKKPRKKRRVQPSLSEKKKSVYYRRRCVGKGAEHCPGSRSWQVPELSFEASNSDLSSLCSQSYATEGNFLYWKTRMIQIIARMFHIHPLMSPNHFSSSLLSI